MTSTTAPARPRLSFAAMRHPHFRWFFFTYMLAMMADNIEHVISYWVMFQRFHSPALAGFAVVSHWVPYLFFGIAVGALADRYDPRRLVQIGMVLFIGVSLGWGYCFVTGRLAMWGAMGLLVIHGCASLFWQTGTQVLLHEVVPREDLQSGVRLNATARYLGVLVGPAVGGAMLIGLGPSKGIFLNTCYYLPLLLWMQAAPFRKGKPPHTPSPRAIKGLSDIFRIFGEVGRMPAIVTMVTLTGAAAALVGNSYQAQMPNFAVDLGHGNPGAAYSMLLAADAAGALFAAFALETIGFLPSTPRAALTLALGWCVALACFATTRTYPLALACLFAAGFCELSFSSVAQTVVQLQAPGEIRGRVLGLFSMAALGGRAFAGISVGILGAMIGVHHSLALAAAALFIVVAVLLIRHRRATAFA